jgi:hypothetical protein
MNGRNHSREFKIQLCKQIESGENRPAKDKELCEAI